MASGGKVALLLDADLRRSGNVACGVKADRDIADAALLTIGDACRVDGAKSVADHRQGSMGRQIPAMADAGVVRMAMGDQRTRYRAPRVDEEITGRAVNASVGEGQDGIAGHLTKIGRGKPLSNRDICL